MSEKICAVHTNQWHQSHVPVIRQYLQGFIASAVVITASLNALRVTSTRFTPESSSAKSMRQPVSTGVLVSKSMDKILVKYRSVLRRHFNFGKQ